MGDKAGLYGSLGNQALILGDRGELDAAMALLKEQERLCRELGDPPGLAISLANQAASLAGERAQRARTRALAGEAQERGRRRGFSALARQLERLLDGL